MNNGDKKIFAFYCDDCNDYYSQLMSGLHLLNALNIFKNCLDKDFLCTKCYNNYIKSKENNNQVCVK